MQLLVEGELILSKECSLLVTSSRVNMFIHAMVMETKLGKDYKLHAVRENGPGGWIVSTKYFAEAPGNWPQSEIIRILDKPEASFQSSLSDQNTRARIIRKTNQLASFQKKTKNSRGNR